jgi:hypothetical protein
MDADGHARAAWPSGFDAAQLQASQYLRGRGWSPPLDAPLATAAPRRPPPRVEALRPACGGPVRAGACGATRPARLRLGQHQATNSCASALRSACGATVTK